jgi:hypothetical protein
LAQRPKSMTARSAFEIFASREGTILIPSLLMEGTLV